MQIRQYLAGVVFVSYASDDRTRVSALVHELKAAGLSVWLDVERSGCIIGVSS